MGYGDAGAAAYLVLILDTSCCAQTHVQQIYVGSRSWFERQIL